MKVPAIYYGILGVFCILTIGISIVTAADVTQSPGLSMIEKKQIHPGFDLTNTTMQQEIISRFEKQGTDVTGLKAAFASGDKDAVKAWMDANRPAHPDNAERPSHPAFDLSNTTMQQEMINRFEQEGVDVTELKTAFASGDREAVKAWLDVNRKEPGPGCPGGTGCPEFDLTDATKQQEMISRFEEKGTDVSGLKAAFASGNTTDVRTWLDANRPAHSGRQPPDGQNGKTSAS
ncbi:MAG: hypothetical protein A4E35_02426 [Methanoregula sp. PtaU1.Bin051]|nr:MAG: hypothetical protein A4E35_02426 [Methanoregula sp. PtaU1.Bin051]